MITEKAKSRPHTEALLGEAGSRRLNALVNVLHNGALSLELLTMQDFEGYKAINDRVASIVGRLTSDRSTYRHFATTAIPLDIVGSENGRCALTPMGRQLHPALLFGWSELIRLQADEHRVFGHEIHIQRDAKGQVVRTPALSRTRMLIALNEKPRQVIELARLTGISTTSVEAHVGKLEGAGIVT